MTSKSRADHSFGNRNKYKQGGKLSQEVFWHIAFKAGK